MLQIIVLNLPLNTIQYRKRSWYWQKIMVELKIIGKTEATLVVTVFWVRGKWRKLEATRKGDLCYLSCMKLILNSWQVPLFSPIIFSYTYYRSFSNFLSPKNSTLHNESNDDSKQPKIYLATYVVLSLYTMKSTEAGVHISTKALCTSE